MSFIKTSTILIISIRIYNAFEHDNDFRANAVYNYETTRILAEHGDLEYNNPSDGYEPSEYVEYGHMLTNRDFETESDYYNRVAYSAILLFSLGFLSLFALNVGLCLRCCGYCECRPKPDKKTYNRERNCIFAWFYIFCFFILVFDQLVFLGNNNVDSGISTIDGSLSTVGNILTSVDDAAFQLGNRAVILQSQANAAEASCANGTSTFSSIDRTIDQYEEAIDDLQSDIGRVLNYVDMSQEYIDEYGTLYRMIGLYVIYALSIIVIFELAFSKYVESMLWMKVGLFFGQAVFFLHLALGVVWVMLTSLFGDFCMEPSYNAVNSIPSVTAQGFAVYYSTCQGDNPTGDIYNASLAEIVELNATVSSLLYGSDAVCAENTEVETLQRSVLNVYSIMREDLEPNLACPPLQKEWFTIFNEGLCDELYEGIFFIWGSQLITSFFLFWLLVLCSLTYQYYDVISVSPAPLVVVNHGVEDDDDDDDDDDEEISDDDDSSEENKKVDSGIKKKPQKKY